MVIPFGIKRTGPMFLGSLVLTDLAAAIHTSYSSVEVLGMPCGSKPYLPQF